MHRGCQGGRLSNGFPNTSLGSGEYYPATDSKYLDDDPVNQHAKLNGALDGDHRKPAAPRPLVLATENEEQ